MNRADEKTSSASAWQIRTLAESASYLEHSGDISGAEEIYKKILEVEPGHMPSLIALAVGAMVRKEDDLARTLIDRAADDVSDHAALHAELGRVLYARGEIGLALASISRATDIKPDHLVLWMYRAQLLEALERREEALDIYVKIIKSGQSRISASSDVQESAELSALTEHALATFGRLKQAYLTDALTDDISEHGATALRRVLASAARFAGETPKFEDPLQRPEWLYMPGLKPQPFFDTLEFGWVSKFQSHASEIKDELLRLLSDKVELEPYVKIDRNLDAMQWATLNHSDAWSSFHLYKGGQKINENCNRCPLTLEALRDVPLVEIDDHAPEVFFSILRPGAYIPPHYGLGNHKLAVHLPLLVPDACAIRVGSETRGWTEGECLIFDDSFEHEAWNRSDHIRVVLIMEIWNPDVTAVEQAALRKTIAALAEFNRKISDR